MNAREVLSALVQRWAAMSARVRLILLVCAGAGVAVGLVAFFLARPPTRSVLFSGLSRDDVAAIGQRLDARSIGYDVDENGGTIRVDANRVHEARLSLAADGLPDTSGVGFEIFDEQRFGESEFSEQIKFLRALEGELARTISHLGGVQSARVHLVLPPRTLFSANESPASASVALRLDSGVRLGEDQVRGIVHLVASSVRGLAPSDVTVVDGNGRRLSGREESDEQQADDALSFRREIERTKAQEAQRLLDTALGLGESVVSVAAEVNFTREERTVEEFDPTQSVTRSFQMTDEHDPAASSATVAGVPGTQSNLPGGPAPTTGESTTSTLVRRSETRNFEVSKTIRHAFEPVGRVLKLQIAVIVNGRWSGSGAHRTFTPRSASELAQLATIVGSAVGIDSSRGDRVTVECVRFPPASSAGTEVLRAGPIAVALENPGATTGALALLLLAVVALVLLRRRPKAPTWVQPSGVAAALGATSLPALPKQSDKSDNGAATIDLNEPRMLSLEIATRDPDAAVGVVRRWLNEQPVDQP